MKRAAKLLLSIALLTFLATCKKNTDKDKMNIPYEGVAADGSDPYVIFGNKWNHYNITYFFSTPTSDISVASQKQAIRDAFTIWDNACDLTFTETTNRNSADIIFLFGNSSHSDPALGTCPSIFQTNTLAHGYYPPPNGSFAGDIHFNDYFNWNVTGDPQYHDLQTTAIHEIGHALGLDHTSNILESVMYPSYSGVRRSLHQDDINGINAIYPPLNNGSGAKISLYGNLNFGTVNVNTSLTRQLTITNTGTSNLVITSITTPSGFSSNFVSSITISPGTSYAANITFLPTAAQNYSGNIQIISNATSGTNSIQSTGTGVTPTNNNAIIQLNGSLAYGNVNVGNSVTKQININNVGTSNLVVSSFSYPFGYSVSMQTPFTILPNGSASVNVTFNPNAVGAYNGTFYVNSNATSGNNSTPITGQGVQSSGNPFSSPPLGQWTGCANSTLLLCGVWRAYDFKSRVVEMNSAQGFIKLEVLNCNQFNYQSAVVDVIKSSDCSIQYATGTQSPNLSLIITIPVNFSVPGSLSMDLPVNVIESNGSISRHYAGNLFVSW